ncbi:MAG: PUA domain-containing protein [Candidatus Hodarchaeota archaeon]
MRVKHRTLLRVKELRVLLGELEKYPSIIHQTLKDPAGIKGTVERVLLADKTELYFVQGTLWLVVKSNLLFPGLPALLEGTVQLPQVVVDMGAVAHIINGADVMAPGIFELDRTLTEGMLAVVIDQKNLMPLAVGRMLMDAATVLETRRGRAIETLHYIGDAVWNLVKELSE